MRTAALQRCCPCTGLRLGSADWTSAMLAPFDPAFNKRRGYTRSCRRSIDSGGRILYVTFSILCWSRIQNRTKGWDEQSTPEPFARVGRDQANHLIGQPGYLLSELICRMAGPTRPIISSAFFTAIFGFDVAVGRRPPQLETRKSGCQTTMETNV